MLPNSDLKRIRGISAGFPFVISEWLRHSDELNIEELEQARKEYCIFIEWCFERLSKSCILFLRKISTLTQSLSVDDYERLTGERTGECSLTLEKLEKEWILDRQEDTFWFRHDLIKPCIESRLSNSERIKYNSEAAELFESNLKANQVSLKSRLPLLLKCAYHFHMCHLYEKSLDYNYEAADFSRNIGALDVAENCYLRIIDAATQLNKEKYVTHAKFSLAEIYEIWGRLDDARSLNMEILKTCIENHNKLAEARALRNIAMIEQDQGNISEARKLYNESLENYQELGEKQGIAQTLNNIAMIEYSQDNVVEAKRLYNESLRINQELGNKKGLAQILHNLAMIEFCQDNVDDAKRLYNESLRIKQNLDNSQGIAITLHQLARIEHIRGDIVEAKRLYNESLKIAQEMSDKKGISITLHNLAMIEFEQRNFEEAKKLFTESLKIKQYLGNKKEIAITTHKLARIEHIQRHMVEAQRLYNESLRIYRELEDKEEIGVSLGILGVFSIDNEETKIAFKCFAEAAYILHQIKSPTESDTIGLLVGTSRMLKEEEFQKTMSEMPEQVVLYTQRTIETNAELSSISKWLT